MIDVLRRKLVTTAMASLLILLVLLNLAAAAVFLIRLDIQTDRELDALSSDRMTMGNDRVTASLGTLKYFTCIVDQAGRFVMANIVFDPAVGEDTVREYTQRALSGDDTGRIGSYKYSVRHMSFGGYRIVFLDTSESTRSTRGILLAVAGVSAVCMGLMYLIVYFVSGRAMRPIAQNVEKQRRFVTDAGHEIKTPLAIIKANTDALELFAGKSKWSENIRSQTDRLSRMMSRLLILSRYDETEGAADMSDVDISALCADMCAQFEVLAAERSCSLDGAVEPNVTVHGSEEALSELVSILLDNAVKYCSENSTVGLRLAAENEKCVLEVSNVCDSLPLVEPETLFERFYRADSARSQQSGGVGIGLTVARAAA